MLKGFGRVCKALLYLIREICQTLNKFESLKEHYENDNPQAECYNK